ncbi:hypothetical protein Scep_002169 [Stephania cephalantha]|uniref:Uncharacterized protein n=1 Tax=Stephania cephalantha TaxID=152367 RepID=A0AAP0L9I9_9MAGN
MALLSIAFHKWVFDGIGKRIRGEVDLFKEINESIEWHPGIFYTLSGSYAILASIALSHLACTIKGMGSRLVAVSSLLTMEEAFGFVEKNTRSRSPDARYKPGGVRSTFSNV